MDALPTEMSQRRRSPARRQGRRQPHRDAVGRASGVDEHAVAVGRRAEVVLDEVDGGREGRHHRALRSVAVETEPAALVAVEPHRRRAAMRLNAQREQEAPVGAVAQQERPDGARGQPSAGLGRRESAEVETALGQLAKNVAGRQCNALVRARGRVWTRGRVWRRACAVRVR